MGPPSSLYPRPIIALVGRPNVGKSTLFNRLVGKRVAVVSSLRGTTRDRLYGQAEWRGRRFTVIDTGGAEEAPRRPLEEAVQRQVRQALEEADGIVLICDAREGLVPADQMLVERLRKAGRPVLLAVNKADHQPTVPPDYFSLGLPQVHAISALHGLGVGELLDSLLGWCASPRGDQVMPSPTHTVAIVGRPNVGKSSLFNALLGQERAIVNEVGGTTRDAVEALLRDAGTLVRLIDTGGLRRRGKMREPVEVFAMSRALDAVSRCEIALVVLDATEGMTRDDRRLIGRIRETGRGLIVAANKWDLVVPGDRQHVAAVVDRVRALAGPVPVLPVSAKTGCSVAKIPLVARRIAAVLRSGLPESVGDALLRSAWAASAPPRLRGSPLRLRRVRWHAGCPLRVELTTHPSAPLPLPYQRFLLRRLGSVPKLSGVPIRLVVAAPRGS